MAPAFVFLTGSAGRARYAPYGSRVWSDVKRLALTLAATALVAAGCSQSAVTIDYVDFVRLGGITYVAPAASTPAGRQLQNSDLGAAYGQVKVKLDGSQDPNHQVQDGDSAFLAPGTQVYRVNGYRSTFRLAATHDGRLFLYEADSNPAARVGSDLLDLAGRVSQIGINSQTDGRTELGSIKDPAVVRTAVGYVEGSPVDQSKQGVGTTEYFIDFHRADGTEVIRAYWPDAGLLARGIEVPSAFWAIVESSLEKAPAPSA